MISRGSEYSEDHWLWREASLSTDVASFLARTGARLLDDLDANALHVRVLDVRAAADDHPEDPDQERSSDSDAREMYLDTLAAIRRGVVGVTQPAHRRHGLSPNGVQRISTWIEAGTVLHSSERSGAAVTRDLLRGLDMD